MFFKRWKITKNDKTLAEINDLLTTNKIYSFIDDNELKNINSYRLKDGYFLCFYSKDKAISFLQSKQNDLKDNLNNIKIVKDKLF